VACPREWAPRVSGDYLRILREWLAAGRSHAGVILLHGIEPAEFDAAVAAVERRFEERPQQADWIDHAVIAERHANRFV
jgi:hypothetical protein